ncbi:MAG: valine--tRNA ligase [Candidatus Moranbacteria bacterium]|nr:valine--tRNA ligase [Candidatus Moranbacteria bacterium]
MKEISKRYNPSETEPKWLVFWEKEGIYKFSPKNKGDVFSIDTPPPTVSGKMHIGHAYSYTHEDFVARYQKMRGKNVLFPFGTDDNGLPTERLVEKLKKVRASKMKRQDFIDLCNETLKEITPDFVADWKKIGMSCDFSKIYSTIDDNCRRVSQKFFIDLYKKQKVYRQEAPVVWCPHCQTAIAQAELEDKEAETFFNDIVFKLPNKKNLVIATTRPELLSSCVAVFVHPGDKRYKKLIGQKAQVPIFQNRVEIMADKKVDMKKGSGAVMCCTFGDKTDVEWFKEYKLPLAVSLDKAGLMTEKAKKYAGLSAKDARSKIIEDLKKKNLLIGQKKIAHTLNIHERCKTEVEILNSEQWYVKVLGEKKKLIGLGEEIKWHPEFMRTRLENWIKGLNWDWCISRQRFFGIPFPVWYCAKCGEVKLADEKDLPIDPLSAKPKGKCEKCGGSKFIPERDVMDTWATSSLSPVLALQLFYKENDVEKMIPMNLRPQAHDIISTWLFYTVVRSNYHFEKIPWSEVMISGHVLDSAGRKMSKSLGNTVEPQKIIENFGADALRFWAAGRTLGQNINFSEEEIQAGKKFLTKLWNATRFVMMNINTRELNNSRIGANYKRIRANLYPTDKWILAELQELVATTTKSFEKYDYSSAKMAMEKFFWIKLADNYIEIVKNRLYDESPKNKKGRESAQYTLYSVLFTLLRLLAPFIPFATEEIYQTFFKSAKDAKSIHLCGWPEADKKLADKKKIKAGKILVEIVAAMRKHKAERGLSMKAELEKVEISCDAKTKIAIQESIDDMKAVGNIKEIKFKKGNKLAIKIS